MPCLRATSLALSLSERVAYLWRVSYSTTQERSGPTAFASYWEPCSGFSSMVEGMALYLVNLTWIWFTLSFVSLAIALNLRTGLVTSVPCTLSVPYLRNHSCLREDSDDLRILIYLGIGATLD